MKCSKDTASAQGTLNAVATLSKMKVKYQKSVRDEMTEMQIEELISFIEKHFSIKMPREKQSSKDKPL